MVLSLTTGSSVPPLPIQGVRSVPRLLPRYTHFDSVKFFATGCPFATEPVKITSVHTDTKRRPRQSWYIPDIPRRHPAAQEVRDIVPVWDNPRHISKSVNRILDQRSSLESDRVLKPISCQVMPRSRTGKLLFIPDKCPLWPSS